MYGVGDGNDYHGSLEGCGGNTGNAPEGSTPEVQEQLSVRTNY